MSVLCGTANEDCMGFGCPRDKACFYSMTAGDRETEPEINLDNALYAKWYLENELGYRVRLTRSTNDENPSFFKRVSYCYPNNDMTAAPDAACYVCLHSNAGGGRGTAYISAAGGYSQKWIPSDYARQSDRLGSLINSRIVNETGLGSYCGGKICGEGWLILFHKCPVPAGCLEIGFFDDTSDLALLRSQSN